MNLTLADVRTWMRSEKWKLFRGAPPDRIEVGPTLHDGLITFLAETADSLGGDICHYGQQLLFCRIPVVLVPDAGEVESFLLSIAARPDDHLPRLLFADWLDEHGDHWGFLIRNQLSGHPGRHVA